MEGIVLDVASQKDRVHLLVVDLGHVVVAAVLAQLRHWPLGELPGIRLGHHIGVEGPRHVGDVDDTSLERIADLERRHRLGSADVVDLNHALAVGIDLVDEPLETAGVECLLRECRNALQRHLLGTGCARGGDHQERPKRASQPVPTVSSVHGCVPSSRESKEEHGPVPMRNTCCIGAVNLGWLAPDLEVRTAHNSRVLSACRYLGLRGFGLERCSGSARSSDMAAKAASRALVRKSSSRASSSSR